MRYIVLVLLMVGFVSAVDVDFDCPDEIFVGEEFECVLEVFDGNGVYDVKIDLDGERNSVLEVWNDGKWKTGYYYLLEFIKDGDEEEVRLRVSEVGKYDGVLKLRQGDNREFFDIEIEVEGGKEVYTKNDDISKDDLIEKIILYENLPKTISLNDDVLGGELVYESKNSKIMNYLPYAFSVFLIVIIGILIWERF